MYIRRLIGATPLSAFVRLGAIVLLLAAMWTIAPLPTAHAATIRVNTTDDQFNTDLTRCSLREAIEASARGMDFGGCTGAGGYGADVITLPTGTYILTIPGSGEDSNASGDLDIRSALIINGADPHHTFIQAGTDITNGIDRVIHVRGSAGPVEINNVTIRYGKAPDGGPDGSGQDGGGIHVDPVGALTLNDSVVTNNTAGDGGDGSPGNPGGEGGYGGGIYNVGMLTLNDSTISDNVAGDGGIGGYGDGGRGGRGGDGGGIHSLGTLTLAGNTIRGNVAGKGGTGGHGAHEGGGWGGDGGGIHSLGTLALTGSTVRDNTAGDGGNGGTLAGDGGMGGSGGGIFSHDVTTLDHTTVSDNAAGDGGDAGPGSNGNGGWGGSGGGIFGNEGMLALDHATVEDNTTGDGGNGDGLGSGGWGGSGGGIFSDDATLTLDGSTVSLNITGAAGTGSADAYRGDGGGIYSLEITTLDHTTVCCNEAYDGGGLYLASGGAMTLTNSTVSLNRTDGSGGGIINRSGTPAVLLHSTIADNRADVDDDATGDGGGIAGGSFNSMNTIIADNIDLAGGGSSTWYPDCAALDLVSLGYTWLETLNGCTYTAGTGDVTGSDPGLDYNLDDNGGPTLTHALLAGSPAIDAGTPTDCPSTDQRGAARPFDGDSDFTATCDIGAYEYRAIHEFHGLEGGRFYHLDSMSIQIVTLGSLTSLSVEEMGATHPMATGTSGGTGIVTGNYWHIKATTTGSDPWSVNLTLPHDGVANPSVCKWPGELGGQGWDCAATTSTGNTVTRNGISSFSDWAVGTDVGPTAVALRGVSAGGASASALWLALPVLGMGAATLLWRARRRKSSTL